ncbi:MarR family winged helix-turn-helix transcriptional regulator [Rhizobium sp. HT1-10]|uniref:MarR family winged helix-turn-helix transcriptional regulator n=1 Tax=Rhizobium sp. HT1-10 TaxID=3111638 RepID=UPI003C26071D
MKRDSSFPLVRNLVITVFETNGYLTDLGNKLVRPAGLTTAWWQVLGALGYSPVPLTVAQIARNMGLTRQGVQRVVDLLAAHEYIVLEPNPHHQRAKLVTLTTHGRAALDAAEDAAAPVDQRFIERIGSGRLAGALAVLSEMKDLIAEELARSASSASTPQIVPKDQQ